MTRPDLITSSDSGNPERIRPVPLSEPAKADLVARHYAGEKILELAVRFNIDRTTVMRHLRNAGVPKYAGWTDHVTAEARELYEAGHSLADISELIGWPPSTINRHLKAAGLKLRPRGWS